VARDPGDGERDPEAGPRDRLRFEDGPETTAWGDEAGVAGPGPGAANDPVPDRD
jgi:hypothetical protein